MPNSKRRFLITRTDRIGDLVLSTPVFEALRQKYPEAWIACLTFLENRELVQDNPNLNEVILYDKKGSEKGILGNLEFANALRLKNFDTVIHLHSTHRMHLVSWLAKIPARVGWARKSAWALTEAHPDVKREGLKHEAQYNFELLESLGVACPSKLKTHVSVSERSEKSLEELFKHKGISFQKPWIVIHPSASCPSKKWSASRFAVLIQKLAPVYQGEWILVGTLNDRSVTSLIQNTCGREVHDLSGQLSLGMLAALLKKTALLISNDSGPVHIAGAFDTPVISIFGRNQPGLSPERWGPLNQNSKVIWKNVGCNPCLAHNCQINFLCLDVISVEDVAREVQNLSHRLKPKAIFA